MNVAESLSQIWKIDNEGQLTSLCIELSKLIKKPAVVVLEGEVGAGKTTLVKKYFSLISGGKDLALSPTYSLINRLGPLVHADLYRIKSENEFLHLEIPLYIDEKVEIIFIEWGRQFIAEIFDDLGVTFNYYLLKIETEKKARSFSFSSLMVGK
ncbi:MAG: tRNA (adenosine(37)-N6)-threonylcarbamoyltransferase complex ATPase subunit type 1 TsaE [Bdellovibrionales bacterium RIFOXYD12_FULL_39_22]|nr:MAG: tRNA (adenosine(37)-N6)-threonylcarbamoyltransferase complex ATPase subunit type 1 TsaE [Bdellovibrionales bacterium RIFOXYB1_FULL_39_21]OFZ42882.1 MAG: tRNA (adenosine(37)-N6)-threonylcarbamoyltransferase complex ATPase subunit type 1 TsaE [Bdellovibrionales bacterium RIFOXYC12_FULL_39_17]OFZ47458.1 MAG: tRNA (adenosine(37)-N6)-threonylcarbamoyltransferase complex ATPase subunit type 1 TsaE [Bdellovibrionales bacterium RIFOXYC1_FULL_39_130]OFZ75546.1 MAG: tRNA (adenosine(37)-N6)-threony